MKELAIVSGLFLGTVSLFVGIDLIGTILYTPHMPLNRLLEVVFPIA